MYDAIPATNSIEFRPKIIHDWQSLTLLWNFMMLNWWPMWLSQFHHHRPSNISSYLTYQYPKKAVSLSTKYLSQTLVVPEVQGETRLVTNALLSQGVTWFHLVVCPLQRKWLRSTTWPLAAKKHRLWWSPSELLLAPSGWPKCSKQDLWKPYSPICRKVVRALDRCLERLDWAHLCSCRKDSIFISVWGYQSKITI